MELLIQNYTDFDIESMCFKEGANAEWGKAEYPVIGEACPGGPFPFDVDRIDCIWEVEIGDGNGRHMTFTVDFSDIAVSSVNGLGGNNTLAFYWEGGDEYSCEFY